MKKPIRKRVLGQWVTIQHVDLTKEDLHGDCDAVKRVIRIEITLEGEEFKRILAHELEHARLRLSGLAELMSDDLEEALACLAESK